MSDGYLWYQGRSDDVFKAAGYRIGPSEIENCLVKHPAVANAAVVPRPDAERGAVVKAFVVLAPGCARRRGAGGGLQGPRARASSRPTSAEGDPVHRRAAHDHHRQGAAQTLLRLRERARYGCLLSGCSPSPTPPARQRGLAVAGTLCA